jgi:hypothetical protein
MTKYYLDTLNKGTPFFFFLAPFIFVVINVFAFILGSNFYFQCLPHNPDQLPHKNGPWQ